MSRRGVSLAELMMAVTIVAILASMALPQYRRTVERGYWNASQDILRTIYAGQQVFFSFNGQFLDAPASLADWRRIYMDDPNISSPMPVTFSVSASGAGGSAIFTATAERNCGSPPCPFMEINDANTLNVGSWPRP